MNLADYIVRAALARGMDPQIALRVARAESGPNLDQMVGDQGSSHGPYMLHYAGVSPSMPNPGLGDAFTRATGLDARDRSTWPQQIDFALDQAKKGGWGPWMGAKAAGIGQWEGINRVASGAMANLMGKGPIGATAQMSFNPVLGDVVAPQEVQTQMIPGGGGSDLAGFGLGFIQQAEERRAREAEEERERRLALFAPANPQAGLAGLYG